MEYEGRGIAHEDDPAIEITHLRAAVKKWRDEADGYHQKLCLEIERVKELNAEVARLEVDRPSLLCDIHEALRGPGSTCPVCTTAQHARELESQLANALLRPTWDRSATAQERLTKEALKVETLRRELDAARALLNRLQRAEAVVEAALRVREDRRKAFAAGEVEGTRWPSEIDLNRALSAWEERRT